MLNNLPARAIVPISIAVTGFVIFGCLLLYSWIKQDLTDEAIAHVDDLAETVVKSADYAMMQADRESLRNVVDNVYLLDGVGQIRIYDENGHIRFSGNPAEVEAGLTGETLDPWAGKMMQADYSERTETHHNTASGDGLLSVSVPILNRPGCSTADCHFHSAAGPVLGFLTLGISRVSLEKTLDLLKTRMLLFCVMILLLSIGGVAALLRMNLFLPIQKLTVTVKQAVDGASVRDLPKADRKLGSLEEDVRLLVQQRDEALRAKHTGAVKAETEDDSVCESRIRTDDTGHRAVAEAGPGEDSQV